MLDEQGKPRGVVELSYKVFNFTEDQDLKLKVGYNAVKQVGTVTCHDLLVFQFCPPDHDWYQKCFFLCYSLFVR